MNIDSIKDGIVIDHIKAGCAMKIYELLGLDKQDVSVAIIKNVSSRKLGKKDIIKVDADIPVDLDVIGFIDPDATVNIIKDGVLIKKYTVDMPEKLVNVISCKNPRCITTCEQELAQIFNLTDRENKVYRCAYCETKASIN
ncbi:MAG: aspartate carbamoyltransferase regulatory subunit [Clostridia bacterium]|nr:aspartate carbamoyltransferase regulatory subunit [Clostridia bacterium]